MFAVGDKVVYPMHGAAIIKDVEKRKLDGADTNYFILEMLSSDMKVMIPANNLERVGVRHIVAKSMLTKVEKVLKDRPVNHMKEITWNRRFNIYVDKLKTGDILEVADVVRTLVVQETDKKLSTGERRLLNTAKQILLSEVMLVKQGSMDKVEDWFAKFFKTGEK